LRNQEEEKGKRHLQEKEETPNNWAIHFGRKKEKEYLSGCLGKRKQEQGISRLLKKK